MPDPNSTSRPRPRPEAAGRSGGGTAQRGRRRGRGHVGRTILKVVGTICLTGLITGLLLVCFAAVYIRSVIIPMARDQQYLGDLSIAQTSIMYYNDENGEAQPYLTLSSDENRIWVGYDELPKDMVNALVAIEDKRFYQHHGVDWIRTGKGVLNMFTGGSIQGGSTLTQQLIKNVTGENEVTVKRKILEIFRALDFEKTHSKKQILEWYLNQIYLGERCFGVGAASWVYFGKDVGELSLAQCASLVGITNNPSRYDPYLNKNLEVTNDMANRQRAELVLWNMLDQNMIDQAAYDAACAEVESMEFVKGSPEGGGPDTIYNWYQDQVIDDVIQDLMDEYNWSSRTASLKVYYGGLSIYTNVDLRVQGIVDEIYSDRENLMYASRSGQPMQSAIVVVDDQGRVVAVAGGIGEKTKNRVWSRASDSERPAGSSIKPLSVYAPALEMGLITPNTIIDDAPYQVLDGSPWPKNAVNRYRGLDTVSNALAQSHNTAAVRVLGDYVTPEKSYDFLEDRFHISTLVLEQWIDNEKYSDMNLASLALGGLTSGVSVYEMAAAYATFPSMGRYVPPRTYSKVVDADGTVLLDRTMDGEFVLKESTAYYINNMLRGVISGGTATEAAFPGMTMAGKTGTTTSQKDLWFVGYTPYYTAAVWTGYDRQERLGSVYHPQVSLWKKVMSRIHEGLPNKSFPTPSDRTVTTASFCLDSGMIPTEACALDPRGSRVATGTYLNGDQPVGTCTLHTPIEVCTADVTVDETTGESTIHYHRAGEHCPEESVQTISVLNYTRQGAAAMVTTGDDWVLLKNFDEADLCPIHDGTEVVPPVFDPDDPVTWPTDDPNFNIDDPATWPQTPAPTEGPDDGDGPAGEDPSPSDHPSQAPGEEGPPEEEPFVPAGDPSGGGSQGGNSQGGGSQGGNSHGGNPQGILID